MNADANLSERCQLQIIQILKFRSFCIILLILDYTILFFRFRFPKAYLSGSANTAMAFLCSFQSRSGTSWSYDRLDKSKSLEIISLRNC